jgi:chlorophyll synthase
MGLGNAGAHGIMTLSDFKSVDGDGHMGIGRLPARLGVATTARVACPFMAMPQVAAAALLLHWDRPLAAITTAALLAAQIGLMRRPLASLRERAPWYSGTGVSLFVLGMPVTAFALRGPDQGVP